LSKKWLIVVIINFIVGTLSIIAGYLLLPRLNSFQENLLAGMAVSVLSFAIAILLIQGPTLTRERRIQKVISIASRSIAQLNEEIAMTLTREIGEYFASTLEPTIDLYGDERGNWTTFKLLLRSTFQNARQVPVNGLPKGESLSEKDYLNYVDRARTLMERVRNDIGSDREVQAQLYELLRYWDKLEFNINEATYQYNVTDEKMRYVKLAAIGDTLIDLVDACPKLKD